MRKRELLILLISLGASLALTFSVEKDWFDWLPDLAVAILWIATAWAWAYVWLTRDFVKSWVHTYKWRTAIAFIVVGVILGGASGWLLWWSVRRGAIEDEPAIPSASAAPVPTRIGREPEAYKEISDEQVGQWAIEVADKVEALVVETIKRYKGSSSNALAWRFTNDFKDCCAQDIKDLRDEILRRLGPSAKIPDEMSAWTILFPETKYPEIQQSGRPNFINPMSARHYTPFLRRLGLRLRRRATPRSAPLALQFSEQYLTPEKPEYSRVVVGIDTKEELSSGYIAVQFSGLPYKIGTDFKDSKLALDSRVSVDNPQVVKLLDAPTTSYVLQIGETPLSPGKPIRVELLSASPIRITAVTYFEE